jgi:glucosyl-3-phosphoglycerate phosphatase
MPTRTFLIRHGQSTFNEVFDANGVDPLHYDARLTPTGRNQVEAARDAAQRLGVDLVVVSPLTRAIETCLGLFDPAQTRIVVSPLHRERLGNSCDIGRHPNVLSFEYPMLDFGDCSECWWHDGPKDARGVSIEPDEVVASRIAEFKKWLGRRPEQRVAVIGHGTFFHRLTGRHFANCEIVDWSEPVGGACSV